MAKKPIRIPSKKPVAKAKKVDPVRACKKPSDLILIALKDMEKVEKNPKYKIDQGKWHDPNKNKTKCSVCFAGSVMAMTYKLKPTEYYVPNTLMASETGIPGISELVASRIAALNSVRRGLVARFVRDFYPATPAGDVAGNKAVEKVHALWPPDVANGDTYAGLVKVQHQNASTTSARKKFKAEMYDIAAKLQTVNL